MAAVNTPKPTPSDGLDLLGPSCHWLAHQNKGYSQEQQPFLRQGWQCPKCRRVYKRLEDALACTHKRHEWGLDGVCRHCGLRRQVGLIHGRQMQWYVIPATGNQPRVAVDLAPPCPIR